VFIESIKWNALLIFSADRSAEVQKFLLKKCFTSTESIRKTTKKFPQEILCAKTFAQVQSDATSPERN
jgi:hypothetical protein